MYTFHTILLKKKTKKQLQQHFIIKIYTYIHTYLLNKNGSGGNRHERS